MPDQQQPTRKIMLVVREIKKANYITEVGDGENLLVLELAGTAHEGGARRDAHVLSFLSDATARTLILSLLPNMLPRARNSLLRFIAREGFGKLSKARPSKRGSRGGLPDGGRAAD